LFYCSVAHRALHSFPTRRSSDLARSNCPLLLRVLDDFSIASMPLPRGQSLMTHRIISDAVGAKKMRLRLPAPPQNRRCIQAKKRSEEHTSELQSRSDLVCRLLLE